MILVTGAAGFIGSALIWELNSRNIKDIIVSDKFHDGDKWKNLRKSRFFDWIDRDSLIEWLSFNTNKIKTIIHLGACADTTEKNMDYFIQNNYEFSKKLWNISVLNNINFYYASSAATYGAGENGYEDDENKISKLLPLNPYGYSKQLFDLWVLKQHKKPQSWAGFKFFNVYGPNEYHKGNMASVIYHSYNQVKEKGCIRLFKSYKEGYGDGMQKRDFVYVKDVLKVICHFALNNKSGGIFNIGTGKAGTFNELAASVFKALGLKDNIEYFDMPDTLKKQYQYFTEASMNKLKKHGYNEDFYSLESGITDYIKNYLDTDDQYL